MKLCFGLRIEFLELFDLHLPCSLGTLGQSVQRSSLL
ncbi:Uncharacterised protein [Vibrio cholerae]|nr:Uncharacterised protein [Vibrio cholerae]CSB42654.1 Uncharacterised protein [Vibrio cholerae]